MSTVDAGVVKLQEQGRTKLAAAQEMMAGAPLDAEAERRARDAGWRIRRAAD